MKDAHQLTPSHCPFSNRTSLWTAQVCSWINYPIYSNEFVRLTAAEDMEPRRHFWQAASFECPGNQVLSHEVLSTSWALRYQT